MITGIRFHFPTNLGIYIGDRIEVKFITDAPQKTNIHKEVRILNSANDQYGGEFLNLANEEKGLGYYLFPVRARDVPHPYGKQEAPQAAQTPTILAFPEEMSEQI